MMFLILVALVSLIFIVLVYLARKYILSYFRLLYFAFKTPAGPGALPLIGHGFPLMISNKSLFNFFCDLSKHINEGKDGIATVWIGPFPIFLITDSEAYRKIANTCMDKNYIYRSMGIFFDDGIVVANESLWKQRRMLWRSPFAQKHVLNFMEVFNEQWRHLVDDIKAHVGRGPFCIRQMITDASLKNIFKTAFGMSLEKENISSQEYQDYLIHLEECSMKLMRNPLIYLDFFYKHTALRKELEKAVDVLHQTSMKIVKKAKEAYLKRGNGDADELFGPFVELLLENCDSGVLSEEQMRGELDVALITGTQSISVTATFALVLLGIHPESQERVYKELKEIYCDTSRDVTKEDLSQMVYLEAVIKETIRLHPGVPITGRELDRDMSFNQYTLPAGASVFVSHWGINRQSCWGADADQFRPERWLDRDTLPSRLVQDNAFGIGIRFCSGKLYAMTAIKTILAHILRQYKITAKNEDLSSDYSFILQPDRDSRINVELRSEAATVKPKPTFKGG